MCFAAPIIYTNFFIDKKSFWFFDLFFDLFFCFLLIVCVINQC